MNRLIGILALCLLAVAFAPAASARPPLPVENGCVILSDQPDMGWKVCVDTGNPDCMVYQVRTTFLGTETTCIYPSGGGGCGNACSVAVQDPPCYDIYSRNDIGTISVVRRDSCSVEVYQCPYEGAPIADCDPLVQPALAASASCYYVYTRNDLGTYSVIRRTSCSVPEVYQCPYEGAPIDRCERVPDTLLSASAAPTPQMDCYYVYTRTDVSNYAIVRRTSCSVPEVYECPYEGAPISSCRHVQDGLLATTAAPAAGPAEPTCMQVYRETAVGPVRQVSRDSCHSEVYVCDDDGSHGADETALNYLRGQVAQPDPNGFVACTWESTGLVGPVLW